jgi:glutamate racemase
LQDTCPGLVQMIEAGRLDSPESRQILENALRPMLAQGIDTVVLGCTHYPFVIPLIQAIAGPGVRVIDPAPAVARQVGRLLADREQESDQAHSGGLPEQAAPVQFFTSGDPGALGALLPLLFGEQGLVAHVEWNQGGLIAQNTEFD